MPSLLVASSAIAGCDIGGPDERVVAGPVEAPHVRASDGLLEREDLQEVVELQQHRDAEALIARLDDPDAAVRARAALALASVQDPEAGAPLSELLADPEAAVRRDAALALGQLGPSADGDALVEALAVEEEPEVRDRLFEALGKGGGEEALERLLEMDVSDRDRPAWVGALASYGVRGFLPERSAEALLEALADDRPEVRRNAAFFFRHAGGRDLWEEHADGVRRTLDEYDPGEEAAASLLPAIASLRDTDDADRLFRWLREGEDWRIRAAAAQGLGLVPWPDRRGVAPELFEALHDPSVHVAVAAAESLVRGIQRRAQLRELLTAYLEHPGHHPNAAVRLLPMFTDEWEFEPVKAWLRELDEETPYAQHQGLLALPAGDEARVIPDDVLAPEDEEFLDLVFHVARSGHPMVLGVALELIADGLPPLQMDDETRERFGDLAVEALRSGHPFAVRRAARAVTVDELVTDDLIQAVGEAARQLQGPEMAGVRRHLREALFDLWDPDAQELALELEDEEPIVGQRPPEWQPVDWERLRELGPEPRLVLETDRGRLAIRLLPELAPATVSAIARYADGGFYDGVWFHRVVPNFVAQAGDFIVGDGTGNPLTAVRTEITGVPFQRGVVGMVNADRDTEGSQFFMSHAHRPGLDGDYTLFGWVQEGADVLDLLREGDHIREARVEPGG